MSAQIKITPQEKPKALLEIYLADMNFVYNQMNTRMQGINQLIANGILLFTVILGIVVNGLLKVSHFRSWKVSHLVLHVWLISAPSFPAFPRSL